eukprot:TRINITY_DN24208_c0_g1_i1.p1 TRINITY_DN24208_c0_g1~~TRINITY_DN24208_c0_g1_i1.p1  ORF type:complete len:882 (-),score=214.39 TRINITY_DN24208_c0_g1_i1:230-2875(-)
MSARGSAGGPVTPRGKAAAKASSPSPKAAPAPQGSAKGNGRSKAATSPTPKSASSASPSPKRSAKSPPNSARSQPPRTPRSDAATPRKGGPSSPKTDEGSSDSDDSVQLRGKGSKTRQRSSQQSYGVADQFSGFVPDGFGAFSGQQVPGGSPAAFLRGTKKNAKVEPKLTEGLLELRHYLLGRFKSAKKAFRSIDTNDSGTVTYGEMLEAWDRLRVPWREITGQEHIKKVFKGHPKAGVGAEFTLLELMGVEDDGTPEEDNDSEDEQYVENSFHNVDLVRQFAIWAAMENRWSNYHQLFHQDGPYYHLGVLERRAMSLDEFLNQSRWLKYKGTPGELRHVFREIQHQGLTMREQANRRLYGVTDYIYARQFTQFERKARVLVESHMHMEVHHPVAPVGRFVEHLKALGGTALRAWRLEIDRQGTGKVAYTDFVKACRALNLHTQGKAAIKSLRAPQRTDPLEFSEFAVEESQNIEKFSEALWAACGCNFDEAWAIFDADKQNFVTKQQFVHACHRLGFEGDARVVYKSLRSKSGIDRVSKDDFLYLRKISKVANARLPKSAHLVHHLVAWVHQTFPGGASDLVSKMGFSKQSSMTVSDFAARLTGMGYKGDSLTIASRAARLNGGSTISVETLQNLLKGDAGVDRMLAMHNPVVVMGKHSWDKQGWDPHNYHGIKNSTMPGFSPQMRSQSTGSLSARANIRTSMIRTRHVNFKDPQGRPDWDGGLNDDSNHNMDKCAHMKVYFHDFLQRPIKDSLQRKIEQSRRKQDAMNAAGHRERAEKLRHLEAHMSKGELVLVNLKAMLDEKRMRVGPWLQSLDSDGSGELDRPEIAEALDRLEFGLTEADLDDLMSIIDKDQGGSVSVKEISLALKAATRKANAIGV